MKAKIIFSLLALTASVFWLASCPETSAAPATNDVDYYTCTMHPSVHSKTPGKCPICGMDLVPVYKKSATKNANPAAATQADQHRVKFYQSTMNPKETSPVPGKDSMGMEMEPVYEETDASENPPGEFSVPLERQQQIGVTYTTVGKKALQQTVRAVGTVATDITRQRDFVAPASGSVVSLGVSSTGENVEKGQPLLTIYSPALLTDEQDFAGAVQNYLASPKFGTPRMVGNIQAQYEAAKNRLLLWNLTTNQIADLEKWTTRIPRDTVTIYAPFSGVIKQLNAGPGKNFGGGDDLLELANLQSVQIWVQFHQDDLSLLKIGLPMEITSSSWPGETFSGKIAAIDPFLNPDTRTIRVRIDIENPDLKLRPEMYVNAELQIDDGEQLAVPINAVLPTGRRNIVFIDKGDGKLEPRFITLGRQYGDDYQVLSGLKEGERIVDSANFLIDAESQIQGALKSW